MARPTIFSEEITSIVCDRLASGESLRSICRDEDMPAITTIMRWLITKEPQFIEFRQQYEIAREIQAETLADELLDIADDGTNDWVERFDKDGGDSTYTLNGEHVQRSRLRVDTRKWYLSKVLPKFADKQHIDHTTKGDKIGDKIDLSKYTDEELRTLAELQRKGRVSEA
jgi:hypothetical protein